jgi:hypothetical protein
MKIVIWNTKRNRSIWLTKVNHISLASARPNASLCNWAWEDTQADTRSVRRTQVRAGSLLWSIPLQPALSTRNSKHWFENLVIAVRRCANIKQSLKRANQTECKIERALPMLCSRKGCADVNLLLHYTHLQAWKLSPNSLSLSVKFPEAPRSNNS